MTQREWGRSIGAQSKQTKPDTETERKLKYKRIEILVATMERGHHKRVERIVKRKRSRK